jgi:hypothetical protein
MDMYESLSHPKLDCKHHVVFIPKCRKRTLYRQLRGYLWENMEFHWSIFLGWGIFCLGRGRDKQLIWEYIRNRGKEDQRPDPAASADRPPLGGPRHGAVASATQDSRFERLKILKPPALPGDTYCTISRMRNAGASCRRPASAELACVGPAD